MKWEGDHIAWPVGHPLKRDGSSQKDRPLSALLPENTPINAQSIEDLLVYTYRLAEKIAYFDPRKSPETPAGNWQAFFPGEDPKILQQLLRERTKEEDGKLEPHQALFLTFLKLLDLVRQDLNGLTQAHLSFYYEEVLGFKRRPAKADEVHVLFELAKQASQAKLAAGTTLTAGKDASKKPLHYRLQHELVINQAKVKTVKSNRGAHPHTSEEIEHKLPAKEAFPPFGIGYVEQGNLLIGIENLNPDGQLSLLFQIVEGSARFQEGLAKGDIQWSYWQGGQWRELPSEYVVLDTTVNLQQAGIIIFSFAGKALPTLGDASVGEDLYWIRAHIRNQHAELAPLILDIQAQAAIARFEDQNNDPGHLEKPLEANKIKNLQVRDPQIRKVKQPYSSFGGAGEEQDQNFFARVSERLRHKQRAINLWDMDHLVLSEFDEVYRVKTVSHTGRDHRGFYSEFRPGQVEIVVIPRIHDISLANALQPKTSNALRQRIHDYLSRYAAPAVQIRVSNARYEQLMLDFQVGFREGYDRGYYRAVLNEALKRHLAPWAYEEGADVAFGGRIYRSQLLAFVENLPYVDYVNNFQLFHQNAGPGIGEMTVDVDFYFRSVGGDIVEVAEASTATSVLVSAAEHRIEVFG